MRLAITARLDDILSRRIDRLCSQIEKSERGFEPRPDYAPHITLAVLENGTDDEALIWQLSRTSLGISRIPVGISHLGIFPGSPAYVFLAPVVTRPLLDLHRQIIETLSGPVIHEHYLVGNWVPHITLATIDKKPEAAAKAALHGMTAHRGHIAAIELVRFPPVQTLASFPLPDARSPVCANATGRGSAM